MSTKRGAASSAGGRGRRSGKSTRFTIPVLTPQERYDHKLKSVLVAIAEHDWHAVADLAMDVRELIAAHPELRKHEERLWSRNRD